MVKIHWHLMNLAFTLVIIAHSAPDPLFKNGAFAEKLQHWEAFGNPREVFRILQEGGQAFVRYERTAGSKSENIHLDQRLRITAGTEYEIRFQYRTVGDLAPVVTLTTTNWIQTSLQVLPPNTGWKEHVFTFDAEEDGELRLQVFAGARGKPREAFEGVADFASFQSTARPMAPVKIADLTLDRTRVARTLPERFTGVNTLFWLETEEDLSNGHIAGALKSAGTGFLRWPGGTAAQNLDWKTMKVVDEKRYPFAQRPGETWLDSSGFARLAGQTAAGGFVVLNLASMYIEDPAPDEGRIARQVASGKALAAHFKTIGFTPACYELGNEHYLPEKHNPHVKLTAVAYADLCRRFIRAIREVDPKASFGACGPEHRGLAQMGGRDIEENTGVPWWPTVFQAVGEDVDTYILHHYWANQDQLPTRPEYGQEVREWRSNHDAWRRQAGRPAKMVRVGYTEWGGAKFFSHRGYALFMQEALCSFARCGVDFAIEWPLRRFSGDWSQSLLMEGDTARLGLQVLGAWGAGLSGGELLILPKLPTGLPIAAVWKAGGIRITAGNTSRTQTASLRLTLKGMTSALVKVRPLEEFKLGRVGKTENPPQPYRPGMEIPLPAQSLLYLEVTP